MSDMAYKELKEVNILSPNKKNKININNLKKRLTCHTIKRKKNKINSHKN